MARRREAGRRAQRGGESLIRGHEGRGKTAPLMRFWLRKRPPQLLLFTLFLFLSAFPRHFEAAAGIKRRPGTRQCKGI